MKRDNKKGKKGKAERKILEIENGRRDRSSRILSVPLHRRDSALSGKQISYLRARETEKRVSARTALSEKLWSSAILNQIRSRAKGRSARPNDEKFALVLVSSLSLSLPLMRAAEKRREGKKEKGRGRDGKRNEN